MDGGITSLGEPTPASSPFSSSSLFPPSPRRPLLQRGAGGGGVEQLQQKGGSGAPGSPRRPIDGMENRHAVALHPSARGGKGEDHLPTTALQQAAHQLGRLSEWVAIPRAAAGGGGGAGGRQV